MQEKFVEKSNCLAEYFSFNLSELLKNYQEQKKAISREKNNSIGFFTYFSSKEDKPYKEKPDPEFIALLQELSKKNKLTNHDISKIIHRVVKLSDYDKEYLGIPYYKTLIDDIREQIGKENFEFFKKLKAHDYYFYKKLKVIVTHPLYETIRTKVLKYKQEYTHLDEIMDLIDVDLLDEAVMSVIFSPLKEKTYLKEIGAKKLPDISFEQPMAPFSNRLIKFKICVLIKEAGFLNQDIIHFIPDFRINSLYKIVNYLSNNGLLTKQNFNFLPSSGSLAEDSIAWIIKIFSKYKDFTAADFLKEFFSSENNFAIIGILRELHDNKNGDHLLNAQNLEKAIKHPNKASLSSALLRLRPKELSRSSKRDKRLVNSIKEKYQEDLEFFLACNYPNEIFGILEYLELNNLCGDIENKISLKNYLKTHPHQKEIANVSYGLTIPPAWGGRTLILNRDQFDNICKYAHLLSTGEDQSILDNIPNHLLNANFLGRIFNYCALIQDQENAKERIRNFIIESLQVTTTTILNPAQSTHTASVHESVSDSASRLKETYKNELGKKGIEGVLEDIRSYIRTLPGNLDELRNENSAAKRLMINLFPDSLFWQYEDKKSEITNLELLALAWLAIGDKDKLLCTVTEAKARFVRHLYEIQRGYNLDEDGEDRGGEDMPICLPGSFNKIIEGLNTIHPDVEIKYITKPGAILKLQSSNIVMEEICKYLNLENLTLKKLKGLKEVIQTWDINDNPDSIKDIWNNVKDFIEESMIDYKSAFQTEQLFKEFIDATGFWCIDMDKLNEAIETQIILRDNPVPKVIQSSNITEETKDETNYPLKVQPKKANNSPNEIEQQENEVNALAKPYGESIFSITSQLIKIMKKDPKNPEQHLETLYLVKQALHTPSPENISLCQQQANKISSVSAMTKIISGILLCLAGALAIALSVVFTGATTAISMGLSTPLSLPVGISICVIGSDLLIFGAVLINSGVQENKLSVSSPIIDFCKELSEIDFDEDCSLSESQNLRF